MNRLKLGLLVPSSNTTMEHEFRAMLPQEASVHVARIRLKRVVASELRAMEKEVRDEALKLADADVHVIGFGCTTGSLVAGYGYDEKIVKHIEKVAKKPAVATAGAVVQAMKALGLSRISVATPYTEAINELERQFLERSGFIIDRMIGLGLIDNLEIGKTKPETLISLVRKADSSRSDGVFISCTNLPTISIISRLEETLEKPVVSSNTATLWAMLKRMQESLNTSRFGKLFLCA
ncbi:MAG TPA: aspartate/glutamate racemase family protein [Candidatus Bathyarchaeia archaeon]|nr:aspartate/glutamate racemase family protein [Candidatus Bathyarchaeia archaeon]